MKKKVLKWQVPDKKKIYNLVAEAKSRLNLKSWVVYHTFNDGEPTPECLEDGRYFLSDASNVVTQEYEKINITWMPATLSAIRRKEEREVKEIVYHEMIHAITQELYNISLSRFVAEKDCREAVERLTQRITRIVCTKM